MSELYKKHRPKTFDEIVGQDSALKSLKSLVDKKRIPHTLLFTGPSGCGKTTLARILSKSVGCGKHDRVEVNCADFRGIDMVRDIRNRMNQSAISGNSRVWIIDECGKLSNDAQNAFLKILEDTPDHVYFMLATTDPLKLLKTIRTRCTEVAVKSLSEKDVSKLVKEISKKESIKVSEKVIDKIATSSEGSARKALVLLNQVMDLDDESDMLNSIESSVMEQQSIVIARALLNTKTKWSDMAKLLKESDIEDAEQIRWMVLGYMKSVMLSAGPMTSRAYTITDIFKDNFYDSKTAGLVNACYTVIAGA